MPHGGQSNGDLRDTAARSGTHSQLLLLDKFLLFVDRIGANADDVDLGPLEEVLLCARQPCSRLSHSRSCHSAHTGESIPELARFLRAAKGPCIGVNVDMSS